MLIYIFNSSSWLGNSLHNTHTQTDRVALTLGGGGGDGGLAAAVPLPVHSATIGMTIHTAGRAHFTRIVPLLKHKLLVFFFFLPRGGGGGATIGNLALSSDFHPAATAHSPRRHAVLVLAVCGEGIF